MMRVGVGDKVLVGVDWACEGKEKGRRKTCFSAAWLVYIHYFKDIRQEALESDCVMLLGFRMTQVGNDVVVGGWLGVKERGAFQRVMVVVIIS